MIRFEKMWAITSLVIAGCTMEARAPMEEMASPSAVAPDMEKAKADMQPPPPAAPQALASMSGLIAREDGIGALGDKGGRRAGAPAKKIRADARANVNKEDASGPLTTAKPKRMVHYTGNLRLKVTSPSEVLNHAAKDCEEMGGYVETLTTDTVILRVPVAQFRSLFAKLLGLGEVMARSIAAQDVTDAFTAMDLRVRILKASRDRLVALLGKATTARAKLDLLSEIRRLTEEIDQLDRYLTQLQSLAQYSRIALQVEVKQVQVETRAEEPIAAFKWIHELSPFKQGVAEHNRWLALEVPQGMVAVNDSETWFVNDCWHAESADGAKLWASQNDVGPVGNTDFWIEAVKARLSPEYAAADISTAGEFKVLRLLDEQGDTGYRYVVAVRAKGDNLQVIEAYFANAEQEKRYGALVRSAIERGES